MIEPASFLVFFAAAFTLAVIHGPGMLYVLARTLRVQRYGSGSALIGLGLYVADDR